MSLTIKIKTSSSVVGEIKGTVTGSVNDTINGNITGSAKNNIVMINRDEAFSKIYATKQYVKEVDDSNRDWTKEQDEAVKDWVSEQDYATKSQLPTKTSELENDSGYITTADKEELEAAIAAETARATTKEESIEASVAAETARATASESALNTSILTETSRATEAESALNTSIAAETARATASESALSTSISTETSRATQAENTLNTSISTETARATASEEALAASVVTETTRATEAESALGVSISSEIARATASEEALSAAIAQAGKIDDVQVNGTSVVTDKVANVVVPTKTSDLTNDSGYLTEHQDISGKENISNKTTSITSDSTDTQYPSAKAVKNYVDNNGGKIDVIKVNNVEQEIVEKTVNITIPDAAMKIKRNDVVIAPDSAGYVNINVPTKTSDITNDSGFVTNATAQIAESQVDGLEDDISTLNEKIAGLKNTYVTSTLKNSSLDSQDDVVEASFLIDTLGHKISKDDSAQIGDTVLVEETDVPDRWISGFKTVGKTYQELEYIESSGTQYIDTGVIGTDNHTITATFEFNDVVADPVNIYGARSSASVNNISSLKDNGNSNLFLDFNNSDYEIYRFQSVVQKNVKYTTTNSKELAKLVNAETGVVINTKIRSCTDTIQTPHTLLLFDTFGSFTTNKFVGKVYSFSIVDGTNTILNLIPVRRLSDNAICMYDLVSNTYFENSGTGDFIAGPDKEETSEDDFITFSSDNQFTLAFSSITSGGTGLNNKGSWDGTLEYSTDKETWIEIDKTATPTISSVDGKIYLRGNNNTSLSASVSEGTRFVLTGTNIRCTGNIETLRGYRTDGSGTYPAMGDYCYGWTFKNCTSLIEAPAFPATELGKQCYRGTFVNCTSLKTIPALPAAALTEYCYSGMFYGCSSLKFSETQTSECSNEYRIPSSETGVEASSWNNAMLTSTSGTFTSNPSINTTYYTNATIVKEEPTTVTYNLLLSKLETAKQKVVDVKQNGASVVDGNGVAMIAESPTKVKLNGTAVTLDTNGYANIPVATSNTDGVSNNHIGLVTTKPYGQSGLLIDANGSIAISQQEASTILSNRGKASANTFPYAITPYNIDNVTKGVLSDYKGAAWTSAEQAAAKLRIGIAETGTTTAVTIASENWEEE